MSRRGSAAGAVSGFAAKKIPQFTDDKNNEASNP
jgi:hypothetical protein